MITPECLLILDYRHLNLEQWLFRELPTQLAGEGQLVTDPLPFEFRAIEALLQYRVSPARLQPPAFVLLQMPSRREAQDSAGEGKGEGEARRCRGPGPAARAGRASAGMCVVSPTAVSRWQGRVPAPYPGTAVAVRTCRAPAMPWGLSNKCTFDFTLIYFLSPSYVLVFREFCS